MNLIDKISLHTRFTNELIKYGYSKEAAEKIAFYILN